MKLTDPILASGATLKNPAHRLAAIDLDGTLLCPNKDISAENLRAIERLQAAGLEVMLASGRHYQAMLPYAKEIPGIQWILSAQGADVATQSRDQVLRQSFLEKDEAYEILAMGQRLGFSVMLYTPKGVMAQTADQDDVDYYCGLTGLELYKAGEDECLLPTVFKIIWVGKEARVSELRGHEEVQTLQVQHVHSDKRFYEFMPYQTSKGTGLAVLAEELGLTPENVVVFGDAENDIPMFEWAGTAIAMDHGWPRAKAAADHVTTDGPAETAFARGVEFVLG